MLVGAVPACSSASSTSQSNEVIEACLTQAGVESIEQINDLATPDAASLDKCLAAAGGSIVKLQKSLSQIQVAQSEIEIQQRTCLSDKGWSLPNDANWGNPIKLAAPVPIERRPQLVDDYVACMGLDEKSAKMVGDAMMGATMADAARQDALNAANADG